MVKLKSIIHFGEGFQIQIDFRKSVLMFIYSSDFERHAFAAFEALKTEGVRHVESAFLSWQTTLVVLQQLEEYLEHDIVVVLVLQQLEQDLFKEKYRKRVDDTPLLTFFFILKEFIVLNVAEKCGQALMK